MPPTKYTVLIITMITGFLFLGCSRTKTVCLPDDETHQDTLTLEDLNHLYQLKLRFKESW